MSRSVPLPSDRSFGFTFVVVFSLVVAWAAWTDRMAVAATFAVLAGTTLSVTLMRATLLHPLNRAWMKVGAALHAVVNPLVLGAIYFLVITPTAIVMRLAGRDALRRRLAPAIRSYWIERTPPGPAPDSLPRQF
jgi:hypothetical protein